MKTKIFFVGSLMTILMLSNCATIISGSKQTIKFASNPKDATIFIDEIEVGKTPFETKLSRKKEHTVVIKLDGFHPYETKLTKKFNAWYIGNIGFGGIIGFIIDPITGAIYNLTPNEINAKMNKNIAFKSSKDGIYIAVSLEKDENWTKIGQLNKL